MKSLNENQIRKIIKEEKDKVLLEKYLRTTVRNALIESKGQLDEGFFDAIGGALKKLAGGKIGEKARKAFRVISGANYKNIDGLDKLTGPLKQAQKMADAILADMKKSPVTLKDSSDEEKEAAKEKVAKTLQQFGKFSNQKFGDKGEMTVYQAMQMGPVQKKQSPEHQAVAKFEETLNQINKIWLSGIKGQRKKRDHLVQTEKNLFWKLQASAKQQRLT
jgi:hypothetical protein